jgi:hypothetical protein
MLSVVDWIPKFAIHILAKLLPPLKFAINFDFKEEKPALLFSFPPLSWGHWAGVIEKPWTSQSMWKDAVGALGSFVHHFCQREIKTLWWLACIAKHVSWTFAISEWGLSSHYLLHTSKMYFVVIEMLLMKNISNIEVLSLEVQFCNFLTGTLHGISEALNWILVELYILVLRMLQMSAYAASIPVPNFQKYQQILVSFVLFFLVDE